MAVLEKAEDCHSINQHCAGVSSQYKMFTSNTRPVERSVLYCKMANKSSNAQALVTKPFIGTSFCAVFQNSVSFNQTLQL